MDAQAPRRARTQAQTRDGAPGDKDLAREQHVGAHRPAGSQDVGGGGEERVAVNAAAEIDAETVARELGVLASGGPQQSIKVVYNGDIRRCVRALVCVSFCFCVCLRVRAWARARARMCVRVCV